MVEAFALERDVGRIRVMDCVDVHCGCSGVHFGVEDGQGG